MSPHALVRTAPTAVASLPADPDEPLVAMWLHGRPARTQTEYRGDYRRLRRVTATPLAALSLSELQAFADTLELLAPATRARKLSAVKSLLKFGHQLGLLPFNVGAMVRLPKLRNDLAQRILSEAKVLRIIDREPVLRNRILLKLLYASGGRVSELCALRWADAIEREDGAGQLSLWGKGGMTRIVYLPASVFGELQLLRGDAGEDDPIFRSRQRKPHARLTPARIQQIVQAAAERAGVKGNVSPHWFRHAHASHALQRGADIGLVAATLGHANIATTGRYIHARPKNSSARFLPL